MTRKWLSGIVLGLAYAATMLASGCVRQVRTQPVPIDGIKLPARFPAAVEVDNFNGSVLVVADPALEAPEVRVRVRATSRYAPKAGEMGKAVVVKATASIEGDERLLRVSGKAADQPPKDVALDFYIRVPKVGATRIRNSGGPVDILHVGGMIAVENGAGGTPGGDVQVRTGEALTDNSTITTTNGKIMWQAGPGTSGRFDLVSDSGEAIFTCRLGEVSEVYPEFSHYRGILNNGKNQVTLRSGNGKVRAIVADNAATLGPEIWDGSPFWPEHPRVVGRLGGYYNDEPARLFPKRSPPPVNDAEPPSN